MNAHGTDPAPRHHVDRAYVLLNARRTVQLGMKSIISHGLRSLLTVLGMVFGVSSVIAMLAVGEGASHEAQQQLRELGSNNIIIRSVKPPESQQNNVSQSRSIEYGLTYEDVENIRSTIPGVRIIVPSRIINESIWNASRKANADVKGTVPWYPEMRNKKVLRGRFFTEQETDDNLNVAVLEVPLARQLFPVDDPIGRTVKIRSDYYRVVGLIESGAAVGGGNEGSEGAANSLMIPLTAARKRFGETIMKRSSGSFEAEKVELHEVVVQVRNQDDVITAGKIIEQILQRRHAKLDYSIIVPLELLRQAERTTRIFNIVLGAIAGISLLVGGIGIMNIMLASVTERTREIGIRRALGAKRRDIIQQFLVETVLLSATGGIIGVILGVSVPILITIFADMVTIVTFWAPMVAFSISALVGIVFGIYPAMRAANMDPVEALRHE